MGIGIKAVNKIVNSKPFKKLNSPSIAGAAAGIALASTMSKDMLATYYYVTQSAKNEKIPPEKRSFVAALDLGNGIMNFIGSLAIGLPMKGWMEKLFDNVIEKKYFSKEAAEKAMQKAIDAGVKLTDEAKKAEFIETFTKRKGPARTGLVVLGTLVGSQIIAKRILTPLIATPMASVFEKMFKKDGAKETKEEKIAMIDSTMPNNINDFQKAHKA